MKQLLFLLFAGLSYTGSFAQASETVDNASLPKQTVGSHYRLLKNPYHNQFVSRTQPKAGADVTAEQTKLAMEEKNLQFSIGPNPAKDVVHIKIKENRQKQKVEFLLYNVQGQLVLKHNLENENNAVSLHELPSGLYVYRMVADGKTVRSDKLFVD